MKQPEPDLSLSSTPVERRFVAFLDVLGFSNSVISRFEETVLLYDRLIDKWRLEFPASKDVATTIYSDSVLLSATSIEMIVNAVRMFSMVTLWEDRLLRGGLAFGKHVEVHEGANTFVVSEALTHAARLEATISHPCVAIHESVGIPAIWRDHNKENLDRPVLFFDGFWCVNPFSRIWSHSGMTRVAIQSTEFPSHYEKYRWFLGLYQAVCSNSPLTSS